MEFEARAIRSNQSKYFNLIKIKYVLILHQYIAHVFRLI